MNAKQEIEKILRTATKDSNALVEVPNEKKNGDYSSNVALILAKKLGKNPGEVAREISGKIKNTMFERVEVAGPGFINFYLKNDIFVKSVGEVVKNKNFGKNTTLKNKKVIVEYTDPNILKEFHIGHLMSNTIGESISRVFEFQGAVVKRVCYQGDVGLHIANAIAEKLWSQKDGEIGLWVGGVSSTAFAYVGGVKRSKEDPEFSEFVKGVNKKIYDKSDPAVNILYDSGKDLSLKHFETIYKKLGTKFDRLFFESETAVPGKNMVEQGLKKGIFETGDKGAIVFKGEKVGLHTRVFINAEGLPTYEAKDLALPSLKQKYFKYDKSIIITANEQNSYFDVMLAALKEIDTTLAEKTLHIGHGIMKLPEGKMSSRTGDVVTFESLLNQVEGLVKEKIKEREMSEVQRNEVAEKVAIGALKYLILKQSTSKDTIYDANKAVSFDGDSGPYLQYSLTRALSVLQKAKVEGVRGNIKKAPTELSDLERLLHRFPEIVEKAGKELAPHYIAVYLTELAGQFNSYYAKNKIVDKQDEFSPYRVALTEAFSVIMKNGLWLLGISHLEKM